MTSEEAWDELLLPLADSFESGLPDRFVDLGPIFSETFKAVRECMTMKVAEGSVTKEAGSSHYRLTASGYAKYRPRIDFLRSFGLTNMG